MNPRLTDDYRIRLEAFEGPLDLLLYLIRKANVNVLDIPMAPLTVQYLTYVEAMRSHNLELAADYLVMAAMLIEIKSRMLLPKARVVEGEAVEDPRAELVRRLIEYEQMKLAAHRLDEMPQAERDFDWVEVWVEKSMYGKKYMGIIRSHWIIGADGRFEDVQIGVSPEDSIKKATAQLI